MLGGPREIIAEEQSDMAAVGALHLPDAHVRMPGRDVVALFERQSEQAMRGVESGVDHLVELQIGLHRRLIDIVQLLAQLLGVIAPVPGREREIAALVLHELLQGVALVEGAGAGARSRPGRAGRAPRRAFSPWNRRAGTWRSSRSRGASRARRAVSRFRR